MFDEAFLHGFRETSRAFGSVVGKAYCAMVDGMIEQGMDEVPAQETAGPILREQILQIIKGTGQSSGCIDPETQFLQWLQQQMDNEE